jgi:hypothetical protein
MFCVLLHAKMSVAAGFGVVLSRTRFSGYFEVAKKAKRSVPAHRKNDFTRVGKKVKGRLFIFFIEQ